MGWSMAKTKATPEEYFKNKYESPYYKLLKIEKHGERELYLAINDVKNNQTYAIVILVDRVNGEEFWYKGMGEDMHPYYYHVSKDFLDLLTPTNDEQMNNWRNKCRYLIG